MNINKIHIQDCLSFLKSLEDKSIDLAIIDPPYNLKIAKWDTFKSEQEFLDFSFEWIGLLLKKNEKKWKFLYL